MKLIISLIICLNSIFVFGQNIELFGGPNKNIFHDNLENDGHYSSSYNSAFGYSAGIGINDIKIDWLSLRFTLCYDRYGGKIDVSDGGLGGGTTIKADIDKSLVSLGLFPINFTVLKKIDLNLGFEVSRLIGETFSGELSGWQTGKLGWSYDLNDKYDRISELTNYGIRARIAYNFTISESIVIVPQYSFYYGLGYEFNESLATTKSMRHYLSIGIEKKIF